MEHRTQHRLTFGLVLTLAAFGVAPSGFARSVFVNGTDVSSGKNIQLKNVAVTINEAGDIYISAPHYEVNEEDTFTPLSKFVQGSPSAPVHKPMQPLQAGPSQTNSSGVGAPLGVAPEGAVPTTVAHPAGLPSASDNAGTTPGAANVSVPANQLPPTAAAGDAPLAKPGTKASGG